MDKAIVHLTDLHFPDTGERPEWANKCLNCFKSISERNDLKIEGFAITGDLTQSPNVNSFTSVREFLSEALIITNLVVESGKPNWSKAWIVGGNHDYRKYGIFGSTEKEIKQSKIALAKMPPEELDSFKIYGLHSGKKGRMARGVVEYNDLNMVEKCIGDECISSTQQNKFRIALIHHHLLPLPHKPPELELSTVRRLKKWIQNETMMLLGNAGLTLKVLIDNSFNIVLHGHKHKQFYSLLKGIDETGEWKQPLIVAGCCNASDGFNVLRLKKYGGADILPYRFDEMNYKQKKSIELFSYSEWKSWCWEKEREKFGYYEKVKAHIILNEKGDFTGSFDVINIKAGKGKTINSIKLKSAPVPKERGAVEFISLFDYHKSTKIDLSTSEIALNSIEADFQLEPHATDEKVHRGYRLVRKAYGSYSVSTYDAQFRPKEAKAGVDDKHEIYNYSVSYPTRHLEIWVHFPVKLHPPSIEVIAKYKTPEDVEDIIDFSETERANKCLHYDAERGVCIILIDWISPDHLYQLKWELPIVEITDLIMDNPGMSPYFPLLFKEENRNANNVLNIFLKQLKKEILDTDLKDNMPTMEALECGLFALDRKEREVVIVGGTYHIDSGYWNHRFLYGKDVRGLSMSRGRAMIYRKNPGTEPIYYIPPQNCKLDMVVVAVPILIPHNVIPIKNDLVIGYFKVVFSISSTSKSSGLIKLLHDTKLRHYILNLICRKFYYFWEENLPQKYKLEQSIKNDKSTLKDEKTAYEWILNNEIVEILDWSPSDLNTILKNQDRVE